MPKSVKPLSEKEVKNAKLKDKEYTLSDGNGLQLLVKPDGIKQWVFRYTSPTQNKRRKTSFGTYPSVTLANARVKRDEWQNLIKRGIDPIDDKREEKAEVKREKESNFANVVKLWLDDQERRLSGNTHKRKKALFENTVLRVFSERSIDEIDHTEIIAIIEVKAIQTPETARRLFTYLNDLWQFACSRKTVHSIVKSLLALCFFGFILLEVFKSGTIIPIAKVTLFQTAINTMF